MRLTLVLKPVLTWYESLFRSSPWRASKKHFISSWIAARLLTHVFVMTISSLGTLTPRVLVISLIFGGMVYGSESPKILLQKSAQHFDRGQYKKALELLSTVDIRSDFDNSDDMKLAFKIRSISYEQTGDSKRASETIRELYFLDPTYNFDPFDTPISLVELAQREKDAIEEKNKHLASIKNEVALEQDIKNGPDKIIKSNLERTVFIEKRPHRLTALLPMGMNHFIQNAPWKGGLYLSLQSLGLITNVAAFWWKQSYLEGLGSSRLMDSSYGNRFETAQMIQYIGLGTLVISYVASIIDALIRFQSLPTQKVSLSEINS